MFSYTSLLVVPQRTFPLPVFVPSLWGTLSLWNFPVASMSLFQTLSFDMLLSPVYCFVTLTCIQNYLLVGFIFILFLVSNWELSQLQPLNDNDAHAQYIFRECLLNQWMVSPYETGIRPICFVLPGGTSMCSNNHRWTWYDLIHVRPQTLFQVHCHH